MRLLIIAALLAAPACSADAQTLYRCVEKGKPTSYQNAPCTGAAKTAKALDYVPDPDAQPYRPAPAQTPQQARSRQGPGARVHQLPTATSTSACEAARAHRDRVVGHNNQRGNVDVRRRLNDAVASACY